MSLDLTKILFEGFLQKRKDTMKIRWATYWFRLQNTTLFFYTKENCSASHLRGYYYIYTVQSVREVQRADSKRFMFEIIMTNGKRKMLAAETAALRQEWVAHLWQAMHLSTSGVSDSRGMRTNSIVPVCSQTDSVKYLPPRPLSAPSGHIHHEIRSIASPVCRPEELDIEEEPLYQNPESASNYQDQTGAVQWGSNELSNAEETQEGDYDVLPVRKQMCEFKEETETDEGVYDVPLSNRRMDEPPDPTESIYDVPSSLLRKTSDSDNSSEEQQADGVYWRI
ncbi:uncharacterized protein [Labrus bergylta]|uniref:uncharacterized protein n=1 Tax=Labrus bergylta TaxID=56723 RepID=UPI0009B31FD2|nr:uncharacterized protein LOC110001075 isoform X1 [Labrus bergylta]